MSGFVVSSYSRLRKPMVGSSVWAWWCWDFRGHGFVITDSCWWFPDTGTHQQPAPVTGSLHR
ncbi:hypothetical protein CDBH8_2264 [Corynebacterium diphtheriae BH8]|nr:hypothetical protein CDBH8_2264 [Corynebacterium diphtheriae BH8]